MMKVRHFLVCAGLTLMAGITHAGLEQPFPVDVDLVGMGASGDTYTARTSAGDTEYIGCGSRTIDNGLGTLFEFGFCQAEDVDGDAITCTTQNADLINAIRSVSDYAFITFSWQDDGFGGAECTRVGHSTQSFYLPKK